MVQKAEDSLFNEKVVKDTSFGSYDLVSLRKKMNPVFTFNSKSLILLFATLLFFTIILNGNMFLDVNLFILLITLDLTVSSVLIKPFAYHKEGYIIKNSNDLKVLLYETDITLDTFSSYGKFFIPRIIVYALMLQTTIKVMLQNNYVALHAFVFYLWTFIVSILGILFLISISMAGMGLLIDDYLREGTSHKAWKNIRLEISNSALELDNLISRINNSNSSVLNQDNKQRLAGTLFKLRNFLVIENQQDPTYTPDMKIRFTQAERDISEELLQNLKKDKCVVCYSQLANSAGPFLVCPICGQGGHKDHIEEWFTTKANCPGCTTDLSSSSFLLLN